MKYQRILEAVMYQPWLIKPSTHASIFNLIMSRVVAEDAPKREDGEDWCGEKVERESMHIENGIATIPIAGVIGRKLSAFEKGSGAVDVIEIARDIDFAERSADVKTIWFDMDTPGGMVNGTPELADRIGRIQKPKYAFANEADSAGYWLANQTDGIFATRSASIGSIGVYAPFLDSSKVLEEMGYAIEIFRSDKFKGMGYPGTKLDDEQRAEMQRHIDFIADEFKESVLSRRNVPMEAMQGQSFMATEAIKYNLLDGIVADFEDAKALVG